MRKMNRALVGQSKTFFSLTAKKNQLLHFLMTIIALVGMAMPMQAEVDWTTLGAEIEANGEYYIYNVGRSRFLGEKVLTNDVSQALCFTIIETTVDASELGVGKMKYLKYGEGKFANSLTSSWPHSTGYQYALKPIDGTNNHYTISRRLSSPGEPASLGYFWYGKTTTTIDQTENLPNPSNTTYEWVFIPKWVALSATVAAGQEYYIYNVGKKQFLKYEETTDKLGEAIAFTVTASGTKFTFKCNHPETGATSYIRTNNATWSTGFGASGTACVLENSSTTYNIIRQYASGPGEPMNNYYYSAQAANTSLTENLNDNSSDYSKWFFIPKASFDEYVPAADKEIDVEDEWTAIASTTVPSGSTFAYLYNPASGCFLSKNGTTANPGVTTDPEQAVMFYLKSSSSSRGFAYTDQAAIKYISSTSTTAATSVNGNYFTPIEKATGRFQLQKSKGNYMYVDKSGTNPAFAVGATPSAYSRWVFITREAYVAKMTEKAASAPTDKWLAKAVAPEDKGLYYIYNPASKRFWGSKSLQAESEYPKQFQVNTAANGNISLAYDNGDGEGVMFAYTTTSMWMNSEMYLTKAEKTGKSHYYTLAMISTASGNPNQYIIAQKTGATNYRLNAILNNNTNYKYTNTTNAVNDDVWNEWLFIPAADFEAEFATAPTAEDRWTAKGTSNPEIGKKYFLYNVEAQKFFKWEHLTANTEEAVLCTIGGEEEAKYITFLNTQLNTNYVAAKAGYGYSTSSYILDWEETETNSKQYYIYHHPSEDFYNFNIYLTANKTYEGYSASAIKNGKRPDDLSGKHKWVFVEPVATLYYSASATKHAGQGDVYVYFDTPSILPSTGVESTGSLSSSVVKKATFMAVPDMEHGYQFLGWKADPDGDFISTKAMYQHPLTITSTDSEHPDDITLYAFFEKYDAEVFDKAGISQGEYETLTAALAAASKGYTIKLKRNLSGQQTINKGVTIDFNGFTISGTVDNLVTVSAPSTDTVTFMDNTIAAQGGVSLAYGENYALVSYSAIKVTSGTLVIASGNYSAQESYESVGDGKPYVVNSSGKVRVNGGYFLASKYGNKNQYTDYVHIFNGNNIQLYGGYYTNSNAENNISNRVGTDMEVVGVTGIDPYAFTVQSALDESTVVATANDKKFSSLADAIAYANNNAETTMTIRLAKDCSLPAGNYVIPDKATLLVPYSSLHTEPTIACPLLNNSKLPKQAYRTLTLESGVHIDVYGAIEVGGCAYSYGNGAIGTGRPNSDYGHVIMNEGSEIVLNNHSNLRAWGFVTGDGTIDVRRGGRVDEMFQVYDFKGGRGTLAMYENGEHKAFPMNQYFIQNVEVKATFRPGSALYTTMAAVNTGISVKIIGVDTDGAALFKMDETDDSEDTWVRKWYNPATDQQVYDINNSAAISNLFLPLSAVTGVEGSDFDSKDYILPITNNFKIHVLSGQMDITQDVAFLPGAELEIDKLCTGHINENTTTYFYDSEEWGTYVYNGAYASKIKYRPGGLQYNRDISSAAGLGDAKMNVHGTLEVDGGFRTTEHGANIFSTNEDAGTVSYTENSLTTYTDEILDTWTHQVYHPASADNDYKASADAYYIALPAYPAQLQNASGFTPTTTAAVGDNADKSFCYINDAWRLLTNDGCMVTDGAGHYYIKPQEYVELSDNEEGVLDHLYHDISGTHDYILTTDRDGNCQWWEVEDVAGHPELKHSIHPENDVYYYYDDVTYDAWVEKRFTIKWLNWDGTLIENYEMKMGAKLQYLGSTPNRKASAYYTYDFAGWSPAIAADATVTGDATYTAQFNQTDRKYLVTFTGNQFVSVSESQKSQYLRMGEMPDVPDRGAYAAMFVWTPTVAPVTGNVDYALGMNVDMMGTGPYTITFVNWDGSQLYQQTNVAKNTAAEDILAAYEGGVPTKPAIGDESYTFVGWTPEIVAATADAVYMAKFEAQHVSGLNITDEQTISDSREVTDLRITTTGSLTITGSVTATNFILESNGSTASGQLLAGFGNLMFKHAYFDLKLNAKNHQWYAVAVPWQVNAETGISVNGRTLELGKDFDIIYYDGTRRATEGKQKCWSYVENDGDKTLVPGRLYMIGLMSDAQTVRFEKTTGASLSTTTTSVAAHASSTGDETDKGWNGVANPALFHAFVNPGVTEGQVYVPDQKRYEPVRIDNAKFVVGEGAFVQVDNNKNITVVKDGAFAAPRRTRTHENLTYDVRIAPADADYTDRLFIKTTGSREADIYTVGQDLVKVGVSSIVPQMWINRYDEKLCVNTAELINETAEYPLGISVPQTGEYTISLQPSDVDTQSSETLYLTFNGSPVWNLNYGAYTTTFEKGTTTEYGLRLVGSNAPQITTGIGNVQSEDAQCTKVLRDGVIYILRGEKVYTIDGQLVK